MSIIRPKTQQNANVYGTYSIESLLQDNQRAVDGENRIADSDDENITKKAKLQSSTCKEEFKVDGKDVDKKKPSFSEKVRSLLNVSDIMSNSVFK